MATKHAQQTDSFEALKGEFGYTSRMQTPKITKIIVSAGVGSTRDDKKRTLIANRLMKIAGQAPATRVAKKSIATFKTREGDLAGYQITLRGARMQAFFDKVIHIVLPRMRDFRGLKTSAIDEMGNFTIGFREHTVFPETADEDQRDHFGLAITIVTTAKNKKEAEALLRLLGVPLQA